MLPAAIALVIKLWLLNSARLKPWVGHRWTGFVAVFAVHNISELLVFNQFANGLPGDFLVRCYHACVTLVLIYGFIYIMNEHKFHWQKRVAEFVGVLGACLIAIIFFSDFVVAGYTSLSYSLTAVKGDGYLIFQLFSMVCTSLIVGTLVFNFRKAEEQKDEIDYFYTLMALLPLAIATVTITGLMMLGFSLNGLIFIPIASTLFLLITLKGKNSVLLGRDLRSLLPFSLERRLRVALCLAETQYVAENISHQEAMVMIEKALMEYKQDKHKGNVSKAAESMGLVRSTFYSKMNRLEKSANSE